MTHLLTKLYLQNKIDEVGLDVAVNIRWITAEERNKIIASKG